MILFLEPIQAAAQIVDLIFDGRLLARDIEVNGRRNDPEGKDENCDVGQIFKHGVSLKEAAAPGPYKSK